MADVNIVLSLIGIGGSMIAFSWGIIKHLNNRIDHGLSSVTQRAREDKAEITTEINSIKQDFVSNQRFEDTVDSMNSTVQNIQTEIRAQRVESREQNDRLFVLLDRRRDGD